MSSQPAKRPRQYHLLTDEKLQQLWDEESDPVAAGVLDERKIVRDYATNPDTEYREPNVCLGPRVWIHFTKDSSQRVIMALELDDSITVETIKQYWPAIRQWQDFLREWQGPDSVGIEGFIAKLNQRFEDGSSYADLTELVAARAVDWLQWYARQLGDEFHDAIKRLDQWSEEEMQHWIDECRAALNPFRYVGARDEEVIRAWFKAGLKYVHSEGKTSLSEDLPITKQNMIDTLRAFRKRHKSGVGKIG